MRNTALSFTFVINVSLHQAAGKADVFEFTAQKLYISDQEKVNSKNGNVSIQDETLCILDLMRRNAGQTYH